MAPRHASRRCQVSKQPVAFAIPSSPPATSRDREGRAETSSVLLSRSFASYSALYARQAEMKGDAAL